MTMGNMKLNIQVINYSEDRALLAPEEHLNARWITTRDEGNKRKLSTAYKAVDTVDT